MHDLDKLVPKSRKLWNHTKLRSKEGLYLWKQLEIWMDILLNPTRSMQGKLFPVLKLRPTKRWRKGSSMQLRPLDRPGRDLWGRREIARTIWRTSTCLRMSKSLAGLKLSTTLSTRRYISIDTVQHPLLLQEMAVKAGLPSLCASSAWPDSEWNPEPLPSPGRPKWMLRGPVVAYFDPAPHLQGNPVAGLRFLNDDAW